MLSISINIVKVPNHVNIIILDDSGGAKSYYQQNFITHFRNIGVTNICIVSMLH